MAASWRFNEHFSKAIDAETPDAFVVDADNYALLRDGQPFEAIQIPGGNRTVSLPDQGEWYAVLPNIGTNAIARLGELSVTASAGDGADWSVDTTVPFELLAGDIAAVQIVFP